MESNGVALLSLVILIALRLCFAVFVALCRRCRRSPGEVVVNKEEMWANTLLEHCNNGVRDVDMSKLRNDMDLLVKDYPQCADEANQVIRSANARYRPAYIEGPYDYYRSHSHWVEQLDFEEYKRLLRELKCLQRDDVFYWLKRLQITYRKEM